MDDSNYVEQRRRALLKIKATPTTAKISHSKKECRHAGVPLLTGGINSNLMTWKKQIAELLLEMFGDLAKFIDTYEHFEPPEVEFDEDDLTKDKDPFGFERDKIKSKNSLRSKKIEDLKDSWTACYTIIKGTLSTEIEAKIKVLPGYAAAARAYDPLLIYVLSIEAATGEGPAESRPMAASASRGRYYATRKEPEESLAEFYERFAFAVEQMKQDNDVVIEGGDDEEDKVTPCLSDLAISVDFLNALDESWSGFRNKVINDDTTKAVTMPTTLEDMYARACAHRGGDTGRQAKATGTVFAAEQLEEDIHPTRRQARPSGRGGAGRGEAGRGAWHAWVDDEHHREANRQGRGAGGPHRGARGTNGRGAAGAGRGPHVHYEDEYVETRTCNECGEVGHLRRNCPTLADEGQRFGYTIFAMRCGVTLGRTTVILDTAANASRFANRQLTRYIRRDDSLEDITAVGGQVIACEESGMLPGFFRVGISTEFGNNILSLSDVEAMARVEYRQNDRYIITTNRGVRYDFVKGRHGLYTKDFAELHQNEDIAQCVRSRVVRRGTSRVTTNSVPELMMASREGAAADGVSVPAVPLIRAEESEPAAGQDENNEPGEDKIHDERDDDEPKSSAVVNNPTSGPPREADNGTAADETAVLQGEAATLSLENHREHHPEEWSEIPPLTYAGAQLEEKDAPPLTRRHLTRGTMPEWSDEDSGSVMCRIDADGGTVRVRHKPTGDAAADMLTKPLRSERFRYLRERLVDVTLVDVVVT